MTESTIEPMVSLPVAAKLLGMSNSRVRVLVHAGKIPAYKFVKEMSQQARWHFRPSELEDLFVPVQIERPEPEHLRRRRQRGF